MIKAVLDTNVILDALAARQPFVEEAEELFALAASERFKGYVAANSVADIYYLLKKHLKAEAAKEALGNLFSLFSILDVRAADCLLAWSQPGDFEDALLMVCAGRPSRQGRMDYIVTRDREFQKITEPVPVISPGRMLKILKSGIS
jgi:predicted nucleic acid-binding protein